MIVGIVQLFQRQTILGVALILLACMVGPGGISLFGSRLALTTTGALTTEQRFTPTAIALTRHIDTQRGATDLAPPSRLTVEPNQWIQAERGA